MRQEAKELLEQDFTKDEQLDPIKEARDLQKRLRELGGKNQVPALARETKIPYQTLHHKLRLLRLAEDVQILVSS